MPTACKIFYASLAGKKAKNKHHLISKNQQFNGQKIYKKKSKIKKPEQITLQYDELSMVDTISLAYT